MDHAHLQEIRAKLKPLLGIELSTDLLEEALRHGSLRIQSPLPANRRLAFVGDAVLDLAASMRVLQENKGGSLLQWSEARKKLASNAALAERAKQGPLPEAVQVARPELSRSPRVLADVTEALIGAVFLQAGYKSALRATEALLGWPTIG